MTDIARQREADAAARAYQQAVSRLGISTTAEAILLWEAVPPQSKPEVAGQWLAKALDLIGRNRQQAQALAEAYYKLARALITGLTIGPESGSVELRVLRDEFASLAGVRPAPGRPGAPDDERVPIEALPGLTARQQASLRAADQEARTVLTALGPIHQHKLVQDIDTTQPADQVDAQRQDAHERAGARQAAAAARVAMNGARDTERDHRQSDRRALGYVRQSLTGTPCGWCAMLISRGPVYRSERTASVGEDGDKYHDNDNCVAVPVWTEDQYDNSQNFELNRRYEELWPQVTKGLGGDSALSAWRHFIRQEQKTAA